MREQEQFLEVIDRDEAERRWWAAIRPTRLEAEAVALDGALGRILAEDVLAPGDVPAFDRSNVDGYAVEAASTFGATENDPILLALNSESLGPGQPPRLAVEPGTATAVATGAMLPRGADAIVMVEHARILLDDTVAVSRPVTPGQNVTFSGTDLCLGELVLRAGIRLGARETGVLAALGVASVAVVRRPRIAIASTGHEIVAPGMPLGPGQVHDANGRLVADAVRELGGEPVMLGIARDEMGEVEAILDRAKDADMLILSGGTSKGLGDLNYRALRLREPGVVVHGVALKPGKPICLGAIGPTPVAILPGFPTSAIFTFHEFVAPVIRRMLGDREEPADRIEARMPSRLNSEIGRTEYVLVNLVAGPEGPSAYPLGKGSGSVTTFSRADGFVTLPRQQEFVGEGESVRVTLLGGRGRPPDLNVIGSHCLGLDRILSRLHTLGFSIKTQWVGSQGGLLAAGRGECDLAGIHLLDPETGRYNSTFLPDGVRLVRGYRRMQGVVCRIDDRNFVVLSDDHLPPTAFDSRMRMINRSRGSGTRVLIDRVLGHRRPPGYSVEVRSHHAVASSVARGMADWGVAIEAVAGLYGLRFVPLQAECYDFAVPERRWERPAVAAFRRLLDDGEVRADLARLGFTFEEGVP